MAIRWTPEALAAWRARQAAIEAAASSARDEWAAEQAAERASQKAEQAARDGRADRADRRGRVAFWLSVAGLVGTYVLGVLRLIPIG